MPEAGWYPDPEDAGRLRWWDGARWTSEWRTTTTPPADAATNDASHTPGSFRERIRTALRRAMDFRGRSSREAVGPMTLLWLVTYLPTYFLVALLDEAEVSDAVLLLILPPVLGSLYLTLALAALVTRRFHDLGRRGRDALWILAPLGIFWVGYQMFEPGQQGKNEYGPEPRRGE